MYVNARRTIFTGVAEVEVDDERHACCLDAPSEVDGELRAVGSSGPDAHACRVRAMVLGTTLSIRFHECEDTTYTLMIVSKAVCAPLSV